jgi:hypothetical protein
MKKLLLVLLVVALASVLFVGCDFITPAEGEGEGEGETGVIVAILDSIELLGKTYVKSGTHDLTVTFPTPVVGTVSAVIGYCSGDYSKDIIDDFLMMMGESVVLFPNADKTIWTGSGNFKIDWEDDCCASYVMVTSGECEDEVCIKFPVIIDVGKPYAKIGVVADDCTCEGIALTFTSTTTSPECAAGKECCGDYCTGLASWAIDIYAEDPFDKCCDTPCVPPIYSCSGTECPISCVTDCLPEEGTSGYVADGYYVVTTLLDELGNKIRYYVILNPLDAGFVAAVKGQTASLEVPLVEFLQDKVAAGTSGDGVCSWFCRETGQGYDTGEYGFCVDSPQNVIWGQPDCDLL